MLALWTGIAVALGIFPVAYLAGGYRQQVRARSEQRAYAELSRELKRFLSKSFPRSAQQYGTVRREEADEILDLLDRCDRLAGIRPVDADEAKS
jgi:hypothetical protein